MADGFETQTADVRDWGTVKASNINTAIVAMGNAGGGVLEIPLVGDLLLDEPIDLKKSRVQLAGRGRAMWSGGSVGWTPGTRLIKDFMGGPLVKVRTPYGATNAKQVGMGLKGMLLDGAKKNDGYPVLEIDSASLLDIDASVTGAVGVGNTAVLMKTAIGGTDMVGNGCIQDSNINLIIRQIDSNEERQSHCVAMLGSSNANVSFNNEGKGIRITCYHGDGDAVWMQSGDNNDVFIRAWRASGGSGYGLRAGGRRISPPVGAEVNRFYIASQAPIYAQGTNDSGVTAGVTNFISPDFINGTPEPTFGTGSKWIMTGQDGDLTNHALIKSVLSDSRWAAVLQRMLVTVETSRIYNGSCAHEILTDGTHDWWRRINTNGDLDFIPTNGGRMNLPAALAIAGVNVSVGPPDSAGPGYRALRVPN